MALSKLHLPERVGPLACMYAWLPCCPLPHAETRTPLLLRTRPTLLDCCQRPRPTTGCQVDGRCWIWVPTASSLPYGWPCRRDGSSKQSAGCISTLYPPFLVLALPQSRDYTRLTLMSSHNLPLYTTWRDSMPLTVGHSMSMIPHNPR